MRIRLALFAALPLACVFALPLAAHATGVPFFGPVVPPDVATCAAGWPAVIEVVNRIIALALTLLVLLVAPFMIAWAGFLYVVSPGNPAMRTKASSILLNTLVGLVIALAAWLIINTLLSTLTPTGVEGWTNKLFNTNANMCLRTDAQISNEALNQAAGQTPTFGLSAGGDSLTLSPGEACASHDGVFEDEDGPVVSGDSVQCKDGTFAKTSAKLSDSASITGGSCDASSFSSFGGGASASTLSCICREESGGNPAAGSGLDKTVDGRSVSWGLMQVNLTGTPVSCGGQRYDCPKAFSGPYRNSSSRVSITDQALYDQCVAAMKDPTCNLQQAYSMYQLSGTRPWLNASNKCGS
jgi:hypothetical protein